MLPILLDASRLKIALVGRGERAERRLGLLRGAGEECLAVYSDAPSDRLADEAGSCLVRRLPTEADLRGVTALFIADLPPLETAALHRLAKSANVLVNVEDQKALCDFHSPAVVRRGDLLLTVSTNGRSPGLARRLRMFLDELFPVEWAARLDVVADLRQRLRLSGASYDTVRDRSAALVDDREWLATPPPAVGAPVMVRPGVSPSEAGVERSPGRRIAHQA